MKQYIMEYRTKDNVPKVVQVEAETQSQAISKAKKKVGPENYVVPKPKRMFLGAGILHGHDRI